MIKLNDHFEENYNLIEKFDILRNTFRALYSQQFHKLNL